MIGPTFEKSCSLSVTRPWTRYARARRLRSLIGGQRAVRVRKARADSLDWQRDADDARRCDDHLFNAAADNRFERNTYHVGSTPRPFVWMNRDLTPDEWRRYQQDVAGTIGR